MADDISRENSISCSFTRRFFLFLFFFLFYLMIIIILFFVVVVAVFNPWNSCVFRVSLPSVRIDPCVLSTRFSGWKRIFFWASIVFAVGLVPSTPPPPLRIGQDRSGSGGIGHDSGYLSSVRREKNDVCEVETIIWEGNTLPPSVPSSSSLLSPAHPQREPINRSRPNEMNNNIKQQ